MHNKFLTSSKKWLRRFGRTLLVVYALFVIALLLTDRFLQFRVRDEAVIAFFQKHKQPINIQYYTTHDRQVRYLSTGNSLTKPVILFVHGAPSSSNYYKHFLTNAALREKANLVAVDRPGYGYSGFGDPVPELATQAAMIKPILDSLQRNHRPVLLVGASYGTSIACRIAMDYPNLVDGLLLLAPSLAPGEEKTYDVSYVLESPFFTWAQPRMIHSANVEKFAHEQELRKMLPLWGNITQPVTYFQGANDELIYTTNATFAAEKLVNASYLNIKLLPGNEHLIVYKEEKLILSAIDSMLDLSANYYASRPIHQLHLQAKQAAE